jgi:ankyrin repeat protein
MQPSTAPQSKQILAFFLLTVFACLVLVAVFRKVTAEALYKASTNHVDVATMEADAGANQDRRRIDTVLRIRNAASKGDLDTISEMLKQGWNVDQDLGQRTTMLMLAAQHNQTRMVRFLVQHNAKIAAQDADGKNALIFAAEKGNTDEVLYLLNHDKKLNVNTLYSIQWSGAGTNRTYSVRPTKQEPLLHVAVEHGRLPLVRALVGIHADINARDSFKITALTRAVDDGNTDMVRFLVSQHADVNATRDVNDTPLACARRNHHADIVQILEKAGATR